MKILLALLALGGAARADTYDLEALWRGDPHATVESVVARLPPSLRDNVTFKYSNGFDDTGDIKPSLSASVEHPRAFVWDEGSGLVVSWNGDAGQTGFSDLELMRWDPATASFRFEAVTLDGKSVAVTRAPDRCSRCHGNDLRPVWKMYPSWPGLFGSINDELVAKTAADPGDAHHAGESAAAYAAGERTKADERRDYAAFRAHLGPRYRVVLPDGAAPTFPYRSDSRLAPADLPSRAFAERANLRLGVMLNRMNALRIKRHLDADPVFRASPPFFLFSLVDCDARALPEPPAAVSAALDHAHRSVDLSRVLAPGAKKDPRALFALVGLTLMDVDIRATTTASADKMYERLGYYDSYFDGSATTNELLAGLIARDLPGVTRYEEGLTSKYAHLKRRFAVDAPFFARMDALAKWLPLPYPPEKLVPEHRERVTAAAAAARATLCTELAGLIK